MSAPGALPRPWPARLFGDWVRQVGPASLRADLWAGLLGAVLVMPQGIAFATLAGLPPQMGLATAILPCIVAALFGSSWHVMSGPTNASSLALFAMLTPLALAASPAYIEMALALTVIVGALQALIGVLRLGSVASFVSPAALLGFTGGAALLIAVHALKDGVGLPGGHALGTAGVLLRVIDEPGRLVSGATAVALLTVVVTLVVRRLAPRWPAMLIALAAGTALALAINGTAGAAGHLPVRLVGALPAPWPIPHVPQVAWSVVPELVGLGFALTLVALAQSIAIAKTVAARTGQRIDANREFLGQGLSNLVGGFTSSYVSCGSLNRSLPNLEAGARTPLAAVFSALWLGLLAAASASVLAMIPLAAIAGLLWVVAASLLDPAPWRRLWQLGRGEFGIALATLVATVSLRLDVAILLGSLLSLGAYLHRTAKPAMRTMGFDSRAPDRPFVVLDGQPGALPECPQLKLLRMEGAVYFGAAAHVSDTLHALREAPGSPAHLLVMAKSMNFIDPAGVQLWEDELSERRARGGDLYFHRPRPPVLDTWRKAGFLEVLGESNLFPDKRHALASIVPRLEGSLCAGCRVRVFEECARQPAPAPAAGDA